MVLETSREVYSLGKTTYLKSLPFRWFLKHLVSKVKGDWERSDFSAGDWELGSDDELGEGPIISPVQSDAERDDAAGAPGMIA